MQTLLTGFAALTVVSGAILTLLDDGSIRHTASMIVGLLMLLYWVNGLHALLGGLSLPGSGAPASVLTSTGVALPSPAAVPGEAAP